MNPFENGFSQQKPIELQTNNDEEVYLESSSFPKYESMKAKRITAAQDRAKELLEWVNTIYTERVEFTKKWSDLCMQVLDVIDIDDVENIRIENPKKPHIPYIAFTFCDEQRKLYVCDPKNYGDEVDSNSSVITLKPSSDCNFAVIKKTLGNILEKWKVGYSAEKVCAEALEKLMQNGSIQSFVIAKNVDKNLDIGGVDAYIFVYDKKIPLQVKSSARDLKVKEDISGLHIERVIVDSNDTTEVVVHKLNEIITRYADVVES